MKIVRESIRDSRKNVFTIEIVQLMRNLLCASRSSVCRDERCVIVSEMGSVLTWRISTYVTMGCARICPV